MTATTSNSPEQRPGSSASAQCDARSAHLALQDLHHFALATWRPTATLTVEASAVVRLGFTASEPCGDKLVTPPEPLLALMASSFSGAAESMPT
jgi:hypothetical protein